VSRFIQTLMRKHQNPRSFWVTVVAFAIFCWGLWYHDSTGLVAGGLGILIGVTAFREPKTFTSFAARAVAWETLLLHSKPHLILYALSSIPIFWGLWENNTAWIALGLVALFAVTWHFGITRTAPADGNVATSAGEEEKAEGEATGEEKAVEAVMVSQPPPEERKVPSKRLRRKRKRRR
jgi:hypothetical protein